MKYEYPMLTLQEVAVRLDMGLRDVYNLVYERQIPAIKIGAAHYVPVAFVRKLMADWAGALEEYARTSGEPVWSDLEADAIAGLRASQIAKAMLRLPHERPAWVRPYVEKLLPVSESMLVAESAESTSLPAGFFDEIMRGLNEGQLKLFLALCRLTRGGKESRQVSLNDLAQITGLHRNSVPRVRKVLEESALVTVTPGSGNKSTYTVNLPGSSSATGVVAPELPGSSSSAQPPTDWDSSGAIRQGNPSANGSADSDVLHRGRA